MVWHPGLDGPMDLEAYEKLVFTETPARRYLLGVCWKNHQRFCPRCRCRKVYRLADGRRRCARCRYTFHDFSGRWINRGALSAASGFASSSSSSWSCRCARSPLSRSGPGRCRFVQDRPRTGHSAARLVAAGAA